VTLLEKGTALPIECIQFRQTSDDGHSGKTSIVGPTIVRFTDHEAWQREFKRDAGQELNVDELKDAKLYEATVTTTPASSRPPEVAIHLHLTGKASFVGSGPRANSSTNRCATALDVLWHNSVVSRSCIIVGGLGSLIISIPGLLKSAEVIARLYGQQKRP
jgi:hypothetical protein